MTQVPSSTGKTIESDSAEALITYITGNVLVLSGSEEHKPEIGDTLSVGDRITTGADGFVELQYGSLSAIRIQGDSEYILQDFSSSPEGNRASGMLSFGSLVAKVRKLNNNDSFEVNVANAVCAVRGTEFLIRADNKGSLTIAVAEGSVMVAPPSLAAGSISEKNSETLQAIYSLMPLVSAKEEMFLAPESLAAAETEVAAWKNNTEEVTEKEALKQLTDRVENALATAPSPAVITEVNSGEIRRSLPTVLTVPAANEEIRSDAPELVSMTVVADPADSQIIINGQASGRGSSSRVFIKGDAITVLAISSDNRTLEKTVVAGEEAIVSLIFEEIVSEQATGQNTVEDQIKPEAADVPVAIETPTVEFGISVEPKDARILVNGNQVGSGNVEVRSETGKPIRLRILRPGYEPYTQVLEAEAGLPNMRIELEPRLLVRKTAIPGGAIGTPASAGGYLVSANSSGRLFALNQDGERVWTFQTANRDGENTSPVISGNRVYSIGNTELVIVELTTGNLINRIELAGDRPDIFGRRPVPMGRTIVLPTDSSLEFLDPESGEILRRMDIPQGSRMTPVIWNRQILTADQRGNLLYIDPDSMEIIRKVGTDISQPTAQAPAISAGGTAILSGRRGTVCAVNLAAAKVLWRRPLSDSGSVRVYTDIITTGETAYVYGNETLYALNIGSGEDQFPPITGVSAPPLVSGNLLVLNYEGGLLVFHNRHNGQFVGEVVLNEKSVARPVRIGPYIIVAGESSAFVIDPRSIPGS